MSIEATPSPTKACPDCGGPLEKGLATVHGTLLGFLAFGLSHQHLWFQPADRPRSAEQVVLASGSFAPASRCGNCGLVAIRRLT